MREGLMQAWEQRHITEKAIRPVGAVHAMTLDGEVTLCGEPVRVLTITPWPRAGDIEKCADCERQAEEHQ